MRVGRVVTTKFYSCQVCLVPLVCDEPSYIEQRVNPMLYMLNIVTNSYSKPNNNGYIIIYSITSNELRVTSPVDCATESRPQIVSKKESILIQKVV